MIYWSIDRYLFYSPPYNLWLQGVGGVFTFSHDQNDSDSMSDAYVLRSEWKINMLEMAHAAQRLWTYYLVCVCFARVWSAKPEYPNWSSVADNTNVQSSKRVLHESIFFTYGFSYAKPPVNRQSNKF